MRIFGRGPSKELGPFSLLLAALVLFMALIPLVDETGVGGWVVRLGFSAVLVAGLGVARENRSFLAIALVLLAANLIVQWLIQLLVGDAAVQESLKHAFSAGYLAYLVVVLSRTLMRQRVASLDTVLGGINVYLVLAVCFMALHLLVEAVAPGSYVRGGVPLSDAAELSHGSLRGTVLYFSFTTLTTLGYGDIAPARPIAQFLCSAEAVIGQLFVAIFIGGLVALRVAAVQLHSSDEGNSGGDSGGAHGS